MPMERWIKIGQIVLPLGLALGAGGIWLTQGQPGLGLGLIICAGAMLGWAIALVLEGAAYLTIAESSLAAPLASKIHHLEREKATLLQSIKEIELDVALQKLDGAAATHLKAPLRARAIEILQELDLTRRSHALTIDEQIAEELARRLAADAPAEEVH